MKPLGMQVWSDHACPVNTTNWVRYSGGPC